MPKLKTKKFVCPAHWNINNEKWPGRGWNGTHMIGRCEHWKPREGRKGKCDLGLECPYRGWRDYTVLQAGFQDKGNVVEVTA